MLYMFLLNHSCLQPWTQTRPVNIQSNSFLSNAVQRSSCRETFFFFVWKGSRVYWLLGYKAEAP